jgi:uncharacterized DUF497 family protein
LAATRYQFDWDPAKAAVNLSKHRVAFEAAMTVFLDPLARSRFDVDNSDEEDRFVTLGEAKNGQLLVVVRTYVERAPHRVHILSFRLVARRDVKRGNTAKEPSHEG